MYLTTKIPHSAKLQAAKAISEYCLELWEKQQQDFGVPTESNNGCKSLRDILEPHIGPMPPLTDARRTYWVSVKYEISRLAYEDYLKSQQLWIQSLPFYGIQIRKNIPIREGKRFINNIRRLVNHALELDVEAELSSFIPLSVRDKLRINRDLQINLFFTVKEMIECNQELELDEDTKELFMKLKRKIAEHVK